MQWTLINHHNVGYFFWWLIKVYCIFLFFPNRFFRTPILSNNVYLTGAHWRLGKLLKFANTKEKKIFFDKNPKDWKSEVLINNR